jgi:hypothetical protein
MIALPVRLFALISRSTYGIILFLTFFLYSCNKNSEPANNNLLNASVSLSSGNIVTINATGSKVKFSKDIFGYALISGLNGDNAEVNINFQTLSSPGTYGLYCEYRVDAKSTPNLIYANTYAANQANGFPTYQGSVTITAVTLSHIEGTFSATCKTSLNASDSAIVTGSFKGDY